MKKITNTLLTVVLTITMMFAGIGVFGVSEVRAEGEEAGVNAVERTVFVSPEYVKNVIDNASEHPNLVIAEVSWGATVEDGIPQEYVPGAIHVNTDDLESNWNDLNYELWDLRGFDEDPQFGTLMNTLATKYGITKDTELICYGWDETNSAPTRLAMAALMLGVTDVKVMNGGAGAWPDEFGIAAATAPVPKESFGLDSPAHPDWVVSTADMRSKVASGEYTLVSIRSYDEFCGVNSGYAYIDKAGEPKGAIWGHDTDDGSYYDYDNDKTVGFDTLVDYLKYNDDSITEEDAKDMNLVFYCGTGWRATIPFLICYEAGMDTMKLWDDGWYVYSGAYLDGWNGGNDDTPKTYTGDDFEVQIGDPAKGSVEYTTVGQLDSTFNPLRKLAVKAENVTAAQGSTTESNFEIMPPKPGITNSLKFTSSDESIAKVDAEGKVTVAAGAAIGSKVTITATGNAVSGSTPENEGTHKTASYTITVSSGVKDGQTAAVGSGTFTVTSASAKTAVFTKANNAKSATVPATVNINGEDFTVTGIAKGAFKGTKVKTITVKSKTLTKASVKGSLKGSKVTTVKVKVGNKKTNKKFVKKYKKIFTKKNAGKKVKVK